MKKIMDGLINIGIGYVENSPNNRFVVIRLFGILLFKISFFTIPHSI